MVNKVLYISLVIVLFAAQIALPQQGDAIKLKKQELLDIKNEIKLLENKLRLKTNKEKESYSALENYNRQNYLLNKIITTLREEENLKEEQIKISEQKVDSLKNEIDKLQKNYAKYVVSIYKHGSVNELQSWLDAENLQQAYMRIKYLQRFSAQRKIDLIKLKKNKQFFADAIKKLAREKKEKAALAVQKESEEKLLIVKLNARKKILRKIKNDKVELRKELSAKKNAEFKIRDLISKLVEKAEKERKEAAERLAKEKLRAELKAKKISGNSDKAKSENITEEYDVNLSTSNMSSFSALRGKLNWPIQKGRIVKKFGKNKNKKLNTVTLNYGVDIKASGDLNIKSVADGVVSAIDWIPGYGSVIIVSHKGDYRTVYSHVEEIYVKEGDKVKLGSLIGKVGESMEGNILHFEIWNSRKNQNPEIWLAKK